MKKMGRPKVEDEKRKSIKLGFRVSAEEYQQIMDYAKLHNLTITQVFKAGFEKMLKEES